MENKTWSLLLNSTGRVTDTAIEEGQGAKGEHRRGTKGVFGGSSHLPSGYIDLDILV